MAGRALGSRKRLLKVHDVRGLQAERPVAIKEAKTDLFIVFGEITARRQTFGSHQSHKC
jgi:hypothetical protein